MVDTEQAFTEARRDQLNLSYIRRVAGNGSRNVGVNGGHGALWREGPLLIMAFA